MEDRSCGNPSILEENRELFMRPRLILMTVAIILSLLQPASAVKPAFAGDPAAMGKKGSDGRTCGVEKGKASAQDCNRLGIELSQRGDWKGAIAATREAIRLKPTPLYFSNLGFYLRQIGELAEAEEVLRRALELNPAFTSAHYNLGAVLRDKGKFDQSVAAFQAAIKLQPEVPVFYYGLGQTFQRQGRLDDASAAYHQFLLTGGKYRGGREEFERDKATLYLHDNDLLLKRNEGSP